MRKVALEAKRISNRRRLWEPTIETNPPPLNSDEKNDERRYALIAEFETRANTQASDEEQDLVETCVKHMRKNFQAKSAAYRTAMLKGCTGDGAPGVFSMLNARITAIREDFLMKKRKSETSMAMTS